MPYNYYAGVNGAENPRDNRRCQPRPSTSAPQRRRPQTPESHAQQPCIDNALAYRHTSISYDTSADDEVSGPLDGRYDSVESQCTPTGALPVVQTYRSDRALAQMCFSLPVPASGAYTDAIHLQSGLVDPEIVTVFNQTGSSAATLSDPTTSEPQRDLDDRNMCGICNRAFTRSSDVARHKHCKHGVPGGRRYICRYDRLDSCNRQGKIFTRKDKLIHHYNGKHKGRALPLIVPCSPGDVDDEVVRATGQVENKVPVLDEQTSNCRSGVARGSGPTRRELSHSNTFSARVSHSRLVSGAFIQQPRQPELMGECSSTSNQPGQPVQSSAPRGRRHRNYLYLGRTLGLTNDGMSNNQQLFAPGSLMDQAMQAVITTIVSHSSSYPNDITLTTEL